MILRSGTRLGPYEIVAPIEAGGMGSVYRARDTRLSRDVAIKVPPVSAMTDERLVKRFEREARAAAALLHPNVVAVYDVGQEELELPSPLGPETVTLRFLVEEYVEGASLRKLMRAGRAPVPRIVQIGIGVARGLAAAHEKGLVHRDLKPENVLVDRHGNPKIADFGLVRFLYPDSAVPDSGAERAALSSVYDSLTRTGFVVGTLGYMSPEQARGEEVGPQSDLFVFGVLLYELLTGSAPFASSNVERAFSAVMKAKVAPLEERAPETPPPLVRVVERCLEKHPQDRYRTASELLADLENVRRHLAKAEQTAPSRIAPRARHVSPVVWLAAALAVVLGFAGGFAAGYGKGPVLALPREMLDERRARFEAFLGPVLSAEPLEAALSPDGRLVAYAASDAEAGSELFVVPFSAREAPRRLSDAAGGRAPFFTRDGRLLLFSGARQGSGAAVWQAPADGSTSPVLLVAEGEEPALSPDEGTIAFVRRSSAGSAVWLAARDGTSPRLLLESPGRELHLPVFAADGTSLLLWDVKTQGTGAGGARLVAVPLKAPRLTGYGSSRLFAPFGRPALLPVGGVAALSWEERRAMRIVPGSTIVAPLPFGAGLSLLAGSPAGALTRAPAGPFVLWR